MCDASGESSDIWNRTQRKARKMHKCCACPMVIRPSEFYVIVSSLYDGHWSTLKYCLRCDALVSGLARHTGEVVDAFLDCDADPLTPGEAPHLDRLAFMTRSEIQSELGKGAS